MSEKPLREGVNATDFCSASGCRQFIVWDFGYGDCYSCQLSGQSYCVDVIPHNCEKSEELLKWLDAQSYNTEFCDHRPHY